MSGGLRGRFGRGKRPAAASKPGQPGNVGPALNAADPAAGAPGPGGDPVDLHFCCICGAMLGFDFEDEIDGEGAGRDICGACNRTKNDDSIEFGW